MVENFNAELAGFRIKLCRAVINDNKQLFKKTKQPNYG